VARTRDAAPAEAWRAFPWDRDAAHGEPFSPLWVPPLQGQGRFDLPDTPAGVIYLAETAEYAVAEVIQHYRGQRLDESDLRVAGHALGLVRVTIEASLAGRIVDLCDPEVLVHLGIRPDEIASANRRTTQRIAATIHAGGHAGLRWWSALMGDWHTLVLFRDRHGDALAFGAPERLALAHPAVRRAMRELGMIAAGSSHERHG
jgi:hypothetical protein